MILFFSVWFGIRWLCATDGLLVRSACHARTAGDRLVARTLVLFRYHPVGAYPVQVVQRHWRPGHPTALLHCRRPLLFLWGTITTIKKRSVGCPFWCKWSYLFAGPERHLFKKSFCVWFNNWRLIGVIRLKITTLPKLWWLCSILNSQNFVCVSPCLLSFIV